jgi:hypothetical protein
MSRILDLIDEVFEWKSRAHKAEAGLAELKIYRDECERQYQEARTAQRKAEAALREIATQCNTQWTKTPIYIVQIIEAIARTALEGKL